MKSNKNKRILNWDFIRHALAVRKEIKRMTKLGYRKHETDWEIHRGNKYREVILDAKISVDKKYVWTLIGEEK